MLPRDFDIVKERVLRPRRSLSPSNERVRRDFEIFEKEVENAPNEPAIKDIVLPKFQVYDSPSDFCTAKEVYMNNFEPLLRQKNRFPKADMYDGAASEAVPAPVHELLHRVIVPLATQLEYPILPNFFCEVKGREGVFAEAHQQVLLGCAYGARGMQALLSVAHDTLPGNSVRPTRSGAGAAALYGETLAFGAVVTVNVLTLYAMHMLPCPPDYPYFASSPQTPRPLVEYHLSKLLEVVLTKSIEDYCEGIAAVRNLRLLARERREAAIESVRVHMVAWQRRPMPPPLKFVLLQQGDCPEKGQSGAGSQTTDDTTDEGSQQSNKRKSTGQQGGRKKRSNG